MSGITSTNPFETPMQASGASLHVFVDGSSGVIGVTGPIAVSQSGNWFVGQSGTFGVTGVVGTTGIIGITGNVGISGIVGITGAVSQAGNWFVGQSGLFGITSSQLGTIDTDLAIINAALTGGALRGTVFSKMLDGLG